MTEPRVIGHYHDLLDAARAQLIAVGLNYEIVDDLAAFTTRYTSKLLAKPPMKYMSVFSMFDLLNALGFDLLVRPNPQKVELLKTRTEWAQRKYKRQMLPTAKHDAVKVCFPPGFMRQISIKGNITRKAKLSPRRRRQIARRAARARWSRVSDDTATMPASARVQR